MVRHVAAPAGLGGRLACGLSVLLAVSTGCTSPESVELTSMIFADSSTVGVRSSTIVHVVTGGGSTRRVIEWHADRGSIIGNSTEAVFTAPNEPLAARISATVVSSSRDTTRLSFCEPVFGQWVVLKADDLAQTAKGQVSPGFVRFFRLLADDSVVAGVGLIGIALETGWIDFANALKQELTTGRIEVFSHGYDHSWNATSEHAATVFEFQNTSLADQIEHLRRTQVLAYARLGITIRTFGAPFNAVDSNTVQALREFPDLQVWFYGLPGSGKLLIPNLIDAEVATGHPDFAQFSMHYNAAIPVVSLQLHPSQFDDNGFLELEKIIRFLKENGASFILPSDLVQYSASSSSTCRE
jgi:peptidoglycan/xylan/chitin deacetylase (PgdA/CDA1 family)